MNDDTFDAMDQFKGVFVIAKRLCRLSPAAIEQRIGGRHARWRRCLSVAHDGNQDVQRRARVTSREQADLGDSFGHTVLSGYPRLRQPVVAASLVGGCGVSARRSVGMIHDEIIRLRPVDDRASDGVPRRMSINARYELNDLGAHENTSQSVMRIRPVMASMMRQAAAAMRASVMFV